MSRIALRLQPQVDGVPHRRQQLVVQGWLAGLTHHGRSPARVRHGLAVRRGSSLSVSVRPLVPYWRLQLPQGTYTP